MNYISMIGYTAAAFVVLSFLVSSKVKVIRTINLMGSATFVVYGVLLSYTLPIIVPNLFIAVIQLYYLFINKN